MTDHPPLPRYRIYEVICYVALGTLFQVKYQEGRGLIDLLILAFGLLGVVSKLRVGPLLLVGGLCVSDIAHNTVLRWREEETGSLTLNSVLIGLAALAYVAAHFRLQGIWTAQFPIDPRRHHALPKRGWFGPYLALVPVPQKRLPEQVRIPEILGLLLMLPLFVVPGQLIVGVLGLPGEWLGMDLRLTRILLHFWFLFLLFYLGSALMDWWNQASLTAGQAQLYLQDQLWRETRGEQRRIQRWWAWARQRRDEEAS